MKKYLIRTLFIVIICSLFAGAIIIIGTNIIRQTDFRLPADKNILILGDSHTECAIDDNILLRSVNFSQSGLGYLYSYILARELIKVNKQIDTLVLSFMDRSLSIPYDDDLYSEKRSYYKMSSYAAFMNREDLKMLNLPLSFVLSARIRSVQYLAELLGARYDMCVLRLGGYRRLDRYKLEKDISHLDTMMVLENHIDYSTVQYKVLKDIQKLCADNHVALLLMDTPIYHVDKFTNKAVFDAQRDSLLKGFNYVDFSRFPLPDSCYGDITHLNYHGAAIFSRYLQNVGLIPKDSVKLNEFN